MSHVIFPFSITCQILCHSNAPSDNERKLFSSLASFTVYYAALQELSHNKVFLCSSYSMNVITAADKHCNTVLGIYRTDTHAEQVVCVISPVISSIIRARKCLCEMISHAISEVCSKPHYRTVLKK